MKTLPAAPEAGGWEQQFGEPMDWSDWHSCDFPAHLRACQTFFPYTKQ